MYPIDTICTIVQGSFLHRSSNSVITYLSVDSRNLQFPTDTLFFALIFQKDGHSFVADAYKKGVRNFIVSKSVLGCDDSNVIVVEDTLAALQAVASYHRKQFHIPVIGITGSNGKTIVKEWLYQLLQDDYNIVRSPKSFNSQIGVPLSVWQMNSHHTLAIFEAGISQRGEMEKLSQIILPTIAIITNIGEAHSSGFSSLKEKTEEKLKLVKSAEVIVYNKEALPFNFGLSDQMDGVVPHKKQRITWGFSAPASCVIKELKKDTISTQISFLYNDNKYVLTIPFTDDASLQNAMNCVGTMLYLGYDEHVLNHRLQRLHSIDMRLQLKHGANHCLIINDSYSADLTSLRIALQFLQQQSSGLKRTVILSDFFESGKKEEDLYSEVYQLLQHFSIEKVVGIGPGITYYFKNTASVSDSLEKISCQLYPDTDSFIRDFKTSHFVNECILIKGARLFKFERLVALFDAKVHQTLLEINLNAIVSNLKEYRTLLKPSTKIMAMVKAFAYGSGGAEIAGALQYNNIDYFGVAYADEGIELRKAGIKLPIMVMNVEEESFAVLVAHQLQPVIYSSPFLNAFEAYLQSEGITYYPVHIEVETGMNRLGFSLAEIENMAQRLSLSPLIKIESVFSHLAASDDPTQDGFTRDQAVLFSRATSLIEKYISYPFIKHISNTAATIRHPFLQLDMVRIGIGLYGIESNTNQLHLQAAATLRSTVAQIKKLKTGETVGYNRKGILDKESLIATVRIGYADGYSRRLGNGVGKMWVNGKLAPVVGAVCMDMTMIDVTEIPNVREGDEVIIFGEQVPIQLLAGWMGTIPYEVMTSISQRVKRIYFQE